MVSERCKNLDQFQNEFIRKFWNLDEQNRQKITLVTGKHLINQGSRCNYACDLYNRCKYVTGLEEEEIAKYILRHFIDTDNAVVMNQTIHNIDDLMELLKKLDDYTDDQRKSRADNHNRLPNNNRFNPQFNNYNTNRNGNFSYQRNTNFHNNNYNQNNNHHQNNQRAHNTQNHSYNRNNNTYHQSNENYYSNRNNYNNRNTYSNAHNNRNNNSNYSNNNGNRNNKQSNNSNTNRNVNLTRRRSSSRSPQSSRDNSPVAPRRSLSSDTRDSETACGTIKKTPISPQPSTSRQ
ncbi:hypothetical protein QE152_g21644 [Popillia japonica]|uniref:GATA zinc finger domain-containing protein 14-like n=1 Tax=Popillia japonica TaxID=7064 RepID=A0AAW1KNF9_POPJA